MQQEPQGLEGYRQENQNVKVVFSDRVENQSDLVFERGGDKTKQTNFKELLSHKK